MSIQLGMNFMHAIDTNIWIYSHDKRDGAKQQVAQELIGLTRPLALPWQVGCELIGSVIEGIRIVNPFKQSARQ